MNAYGSEKRHVHGTRRRPVDDVARDIEALFKMLSSPKENILDKLKLLPELSRFASWMPKVKSAGGECQEIIWEVLISPGYPLSLAGPGWWAIRYPPGDPYQGPSHGYP